MLAPRGASKGISDAPRRPYREALRLADQADPRDEIRFVPEDISQSGVREPQFRQDLQAKPEEPEREQPVFEKEPDCPEPEWTVNGRPAVCAEERRDYIRRTEEFLGQCQGTHRK